MGQLAFIFILILVAIVTLAAPSYGQTKTGLRRKPKIYNALITTDENLVQSRAYPVIQPTIHESGIAHYAPFGPYGPYAGYYNPHVVRFGQPIAPNLMPKEQLPYPLPVPQFPPQIMGQPLGPQPQPYPGYPLPPNTPTEQKPADGQTPPGPEAAAAPTVQPPTMLMPKDPKPEDKMPSEQLPIPLNQYGLPPSLIPLRQPGSYPQPAPAPGQPQSPYLPPYGFNQFPPLYYKNPPVLRQQFLPPYGYLPTGPQFPLSNAIPKDDSYPPKSPTPAPQLPPTPAPQLPPPAAPPAPQPPATEAPPAAPEPPVTPPPPPSPPTDNEPTATNFENIKNGSKSPDSNVPDVPPPPIPSGAKSKQS
ncbi:uncharacterized protein LOC133338802 [Musca vetustissima]|uniref:uncharacterized protein LOC133338802 n=1 Tax=Musca vetustissima TaxID=27455 RepID=UPI002AB65BF3|nr:uncharacterized protein LOC133338802 [Musca vetustissima]